MKQTTNKDMLNAIRNQASAEYQEKVPVVMTEDDARSVERIFKDYPSVKNEFINTLTNKVVRTDFFSKVYENPLKMLKKGHLPYGHSIEELFVKAAEAKGFMKSGYDTAAELVGKKAANVSALYIERNFAYVFEVSISDAMLKSAFMSQNGLSEMVNQLVGSLTSGAEQKEYKDMIAMVKAAANAKYITSTSEGLIQEANIAGSKGIAKGMANVIVKEDAKEITKMIRSLAGRLKFVSDKYNMAGVQTFSRPEDLVFLTTPEIMADLDVNVLASAFNVSAAEMNVRTILVDELPTLFHTAAINGTPANTSKKCFGILMDKDFVQAIDTVNESRQFENGRSLTTNVFLHKQGILANCYFANAIALTDK